MTQSDISTPAQVSSDANSSATPHHHYARAASIGSRSFALAAIENAKKEGLLLAVRARWAALAVIAVLVPFLNPNWEVLYYIALIGLFALIGWAQLHVGRIGRSPSK